MTKTEKIDAALKYLKQHSGYRWGDVLDYICEHWDLDNEWEFILEHCKDVEDIGIYLIRKLHQSLEKEL